MFYIIGKTKNYKKRFKTTSKHFIRINLNLNET